MHGFIGNAQEFGEASCVECQRVAREASTCVFTNLQSDSLVYDLDAVHSEHIVGLDT